RNWRPLRGRPLKDERLLPPFSPSSASPPYTHAAAIFAFDRPSMEGDVKKTVSRSPNGLSFLPSGVTPVRGSCSLGRGRRRILAQETESPGPLFVRPVDFEAAPSSLKKREPSFYQGLQRPWLRSVLRGGITYSWGLRRYRSGPAGQWMLPLE